MRVFFFLFFHFPSNLLHELLQFCLLYLLMVLEVTKNLAFQNLSGVHSAREFVWWYNGRPDFSNFKSDLKISNTAVIFGQGNVALDVTRILLRPTTELASTDMATHALSALEESSIRKVYLVGRRAPVQAALTAKELREVLGFAAEQGSMSVEVIRKAYEATEEGFIGVVAKHWAPIMISSILARFCHGLLR